MGGAGGSIAWALSNALKTFLIVRSALVPAGRNQQAFQSRQSESESVADVGLKTDLRGGAPDRP